MKRLLAPLLATSLLAGCASATSMPNATFSKTLSHSLSVPAGASISIENLVGHARITRGGSAPQLVATVVAGGKDQAAAQALANQVKIRVTPGNDHTLTVHIDYPVDQHDTFRYIPAKGDVAADNALHVFGFTLHGTSTNSGITYQGHRVTVVSGKDTGVPLHVDLAISLPVGAHLKLDNHVGPTTARSVDATLALTTDSGDIGVSDVTGDVSIQTSSGDVSVNRQHGAITAHTNSGDLDTANIDGDANLSADSGDITTNQTQGHTITFKTGSGDITASAAHADSVAMNTGSGDIKVSGLSGSLKLNAGSGDITVSGLGNLASASLASGMGDINVHGDLSGLKAFDISSGMGDVTLATDQPPAVHLTIDCSDVSVRWPGLRNVQSDDDHYRADVGAATGQGHISTSMGDVNLTNGN